MRALRDAGAPREEGAAMGSSVRMRSSVQAAVLLALAVLAVLAVVAGAVTVGSSAAGASDRGSVGAIGGGRVRPHQRFSALVNDDDGTAAPVTIATTCAGPGGPGQLGHPAAGQSLTVRRQRTGPGDTGNSTSIGVFFGTPPPIRTTASARSYVAFSRYGTKAIPTSLTVPCEGDGYVFFVPLPTVPPALSVSIAVRYRPAP